MLKKIAERIIGGLCALMLAGVVMEVAQAGEASGIPPELVAEYIHSQRTRIHGGKTFHMDSWQCLIQFLQKFAK